MQTLRRSERCAIDSFGCINRLMLLTHLMWDTECSNAFGDLKLGWFGGMEWKLKGLMWYYWVPNVTLEPRLIEERRKRRQQNLRNDQLQFLWGERSIRNMNETNSLFKTENSERVSHSGKDTKSSYTAQNSTAYTPLTNCWRKIPLAS